MLIFAVVSAAAALPAGKFGKKYGRKKTIVAGLAIFLVAFIIFFGVFVSMLGNKNLTMNDYVTVNNAYITVNDHINTYNSELSDKAKADGVELPEGSVLNMEGYIEYRQALETGADVSDYKNYEVFDKYLKENAGESIYSGVVSVANSVLGTGADANFATALKALSDSIKDITKVLGILVYPVLILGGAANMFITVNTLPLVLEIGGVEKVGTFTGYYYTATFSAQIASPIVYGFIRMLA